MEKIEIRDLRKKEQFILDDAFLNGYAKFVGVYAVSVYCSLCRHANKEQTSWPSIELLSEELNIGRTSIIEAVKRLEFWGIVVKIRIGKMVNNRYVLPDKRIWKPISEVHVKDFSEVCRTDFTSLLSGLHQSATRTSNSKEPQSKEPQVRPAAEAADIPLRVDKTDTEGNVKTNKVLKTVANELALKGVAWARKRGRKFVNVPKQIKAINGAFESGITQNELVSRWKDMENDKFWSEKGFDWMNVVNSFDRK